MGRTARWMYIGIGIIISLAFLAVGREYLLPSLAATATPQGGPSCSSSGSFFVCVADLDGNGLQQVIVGEFNQQLVSIPAPSYYSYVNIINNNGTVRQQVCWPNVLAGSPGCPNITNRP